MTENTNEKQNKFVRKAGRTILVQVLDNSFSGDTFNDLSGLVSKHFTERSNSYFLTFDNLSNSLSAFKLLKEDEENIRVKFAYYKVFFTLNGLDSNSDYSMVKSEHINYINEHLNGNVLYYKLYRKDDNYLECGDLTLDTKESFDRIVNSEENHKNFELTVNGVELKGQHFRFNKRSRNNNVESVANSL